MVKNIDSTKLKKWIIDDKNINIIDVREHSEFKTGNIKNSKNIPLSTLHLNLKLLDKTQSIILVCRSGNRSNAAAEYLDKQGFDTYNLSGGMLSWN